jgi:hypothetical protein
MMNQAAMVGRDSAGRITMQLVLNEAAAARLMAFGLDSAERSGGDQRRRPRAAGQKVIAHLDCLAFGSTKGRGHAEGS